jgi:3-keto-disaccharide hydrolase
MENSPIENKKSFFQNNRRLVLLFCGICILGVLWGLAARNQIITAIVRRAEQNKYEYIERFDKPTSDWFVGTYEPHLADAKISIQHGVYVWDITNPKLGSLQIEFYKGNEIKDFDVYMDSMFVESQENTLVCTGFFFRKPAAQWSYGNYVFFICNDSRFDVLYYGENGWQRITKSVYTSAIQRSDWNRIAIGARGDHFTFTVNNVNVFEMTDDRLKWGSLGIYVQVEKGKSADVWFDNFGYQSR